MPETSRRKVDIEVVLDVRVEETKATALKKQHPYLGISCFVKQPNGAYR